MHRFASRAHQKMYMNDDLEVGIYVFDDETKMRRCIRARHSSRDVAFGRRRRRQCVGW